MKKSKIIYQALACIVIAAAYIIMSSISAPKVNEKCASAVAAMSKHYTVKDVAEIGVQAASGIIKAPVAVTSHIIMSQEKQQYGHPLDEPEEGETGSVYSVAGGKVMETGENEVLGKYVIISHEDKISTYGNCDNIYVREHEHVRKGQVIASFTNDGSRTFLYDLKDLE